MTDLHDDAPGRMLAGRFQFGEVLGSGGMATVWSAHDTRLGRTVAVKILHDHLSPEDASRIEREARAAARIADTRVVTVLDLDHTDDGTPFLVFEALSGRTLADELREGGALSTPRAEQLADDLVGGLGAAHDCGVLHRDIKPSNVLVDGAGFRITDFGIASVDDETATRGDLIGTLGYLAPERFDGTPATPQSDVFSAAVVLYEAVTGRQPFRAPTATETIERLRAGRYDPLPDSTPARLRDTIVAGLDPDPARRPADARAFAAETVTIGAPTVTVEPDLTERLDATEHLAPIAAPATEDEPDLRAHLDSLLENPTVVDAVERAKRPQTIFVGLSVLLLLLLLFAATRDGGGTTSPPAVDSQQQLDQNLDRIEELG
ncbi:serine/threonine-protein kinase [Actinospongicola halichondriae]|uniref:serine/threonine-protein kinase n=1 Tax=Actinospongicola halichondriae TaxID=3236844 RepID=UPI003D485F4B